jgi:glycosidase
MRELQRPQGPPRDLHRAPFLTRYSRGAAAADTFPSSRARPIVFLHAGVAHMRNRLATLAACLLLAAGFSAAPQRIPAQEPAVALAPDTSWVARCAIYEVFVRDFSATGDFRGVTAGLDRIAAVGTNVVWLMPIYPVGVLNRKGPLGSPYAVRDYLAIDSAYGAVADFRALVDAVHARGMKLILDWVPDHTSWDNVWVREHPDYYVRDDHGDLTVPRDLEGKPTDWTDVVQLDYKNPALRAAMIGAMRYWLEEFGIDGFRVDVAGFVPDAFWREAVPALRAAVPRPILLLAEWGDLKMHRLGFDLTYAWDTYSRLKAVWQGAPADTLVRGELPDMRAMPPGGMRLRFTTNHDETAWDNPPVILFGGTAGARAAYVAMALLPGRPLLYDGQGVESPQKLGLFVRDPIDWNQPDTAAARAFYRQVLHLARTDPAFLAGDLRLVATDAPGDVIAYRRGDAVVLVNARTHEVRVTVKGVAVDGARDLLSQRTQHGDTVTLPPYGTVVLAQRSRVGQTAPPPVGTAGRGALRSAWMAGVRASTHAARPG